MSAHRFHLPSAEPGSMVLPEAAFIHVTRVLRLQEGDALRVFDGGREFPATITAIEKQRVRVEVGEVVASLPERKTPMHLIVSPLKGDLTELVIQKATELGVARIYLTVFDRTDTVARRVPGPSRLERWRRVAIGAAEQSGRTRVPSLDVLASLGETLATLGAPREGEIRVVATEPSLGQQGGSREGRERARSVAVAVGPAGGFSPSDLGLLLAAGFRPERLALHTLRAETAAIAAVAILGDRYP